MTRVDSTTEAILRRLPCPGSAPVERVRMSHTVPGRSTSKFAVTPQVVVSDVAPSVMSTCKPVPSPSASRFSSLASAMRDWSTSCSTAEAFGLFMESRSRSTVTLNGTRKRTSLMLIFLDGRMCGTFHTDVSPGFPAPGR